MEVGELQSLLHLRGPPQQPGNLTSSDPGQSSWPQVKVEPVLGHEQELDKPLAVYCQIPGVGGSGTKAFTMEEYINRLKKYA